MAKTETGTLHPIEGYEGYSITENEEVYTEHGNPLAPDLRCRFRMRPTGKKGRIVVSVGECMRRAGLLGSNTTALQIELAATQNRLDLARRLNGYLMALNQALEERLDDDLR